jgi:hypothetical protein
MGGRRLSRIGLITIVVLATLSLAGCMSFDGEMTLYKSGKWDGTYDLTVAPDVVALAGGEAAMDAAMEEQLGPAGEKTEQNGATSSWKRIRSDDNSLVYRVSVSGEDLESLNSALEGGAKAQRVTSPEGKELIYFRFSPGEIQDARLTLKAGKIVSSNADRVSGGTAEWDSLSAYETAEATVTGAGASPLVPLIGLGSLVALLVAGAVVLVQRRRPAEKIGVKYCAACGEPLTPGAAFCMKCGKQV